MTWELVYTLVGVVFGGFFGYKVGWETTRNGYTNKAIFFLILIAILVNHFDKREILYNMEASEIRLIDKLEEGLHNGNSTSYEQSRCTYAQNSGFRWQ